MLLNVIAEALPVSGKVGGRALGLCAPWEAGILVYVE
jgi:hypothetical protein